MKVLMDTLWEIFKIVLRLSSPFIIIFVLLMIIKVLIQYKKYGRKIFTISKNSTTVLEMQDIIINIIKKELNDEVKIINISDYHFYAITSFITYSVLLVKYPISNTNNDNYNSLNDQLKNHKVKLKELCVSINQPPRNSDINKDVINIKQVAYMFYKETHRHYEKKNIDDEYKKVSDVLLSNNVNL